MTCAGCSGQRVALSEPVDQLLQRAGPLERPIHSRWQKQDIANWQRVPAEVVCEVKLSNVDLSVNSTIEMQSNLQTRLSVTHVLWWRRRWGVPTRLARRIRCRRWIIGRIARIDVKSKFAAECGHPGDRFGGHGCPLVRRLHKESAAELRAPAVCADAGDVGSLAIETIKDIAQCSSSRALPGRRLSSVQMLLRHFKSGFVRVGWGSPFRWACVGSIPMRSVIIVGS
jgi:hypothetical protein